jgi:hypothetical protein
VRLRPLALAVALAASTLLTGQPPARAATITPLPAVLASGHPFATQKTATELRNWGPGANNPGNCRANRSEITGDASAVRLSTTGATNDCTDIELPHTYPSVNGYVYEARMYISNFYQWMAYWAYGNNWPYQGEYDAVESDHGANYFSYHYAPCSGSASSSEYSTNPWSYACKSTLRTYSVNLTVGWHTIDLAFGDHEASVYYDGNLFARVSGANVVNGPANPVWLTFGTGSCNTTFNGNTCASGGQRSGYIAIQWLRMFT